VTRGEAEKLGTASIGCRVIELGTGLGVSTVYMAYTAQLVDTVDPEPWVHKALTLPENVTQFKHVTEVYGEYEFAFIDGHHDYKSVRSDILSVLPMMVKNGAIGFHDTGFDDVSKAISEHEWRWNIKLDTPAHLAIYGV
jgi:predicted O-methyltransferase YrrM